MSESKVGASSGTVGVTLEETDALERSRKKVRTGAGHTSNGRAVFPREEDWMKDVDEEASNEGGANLSKDGEGQHRSYKQACTNDDMAEQEDDSEEEDEDNWWSGDEWKSRITVEQTPKGPNITLSPEFRTRIAKRWRKTLIVTILGRMVRKDQIKVKLQQIWGDVDIIEVGSGYFLVKCKRQSTYELALTGGPWLMFDHYISVQP